MIDLRARFACMVERHVRKALGEDIAVVNGSEAARKAWATRLAQK